MKFFSTVLFANVVSAQWGNWIADMACENSGQPLLDQTQSTAADATPEALNLECQTWCGTASNDFSMQLAKGDPLCCQTEIWDDGETNCYLYMGKASMDLPVEGG